MSEISAGTRDSNRAQISVIIPAHEEAASIDDCLQSLTRQTTDLPTEIIVVANACRDATAARASRCRPMVEARGMRLVVIEDPVGGKSRALDTGDHIATGAIRVYLDADVLCEPELLHQLATSLAGPEPLLGSGTLAIPTPRSWFSRCYARVWQRLALLATDVPGCGLYAVNRAGRKRWGRFPAIHSDDKYVRLLFAHSGPIRSRIPI